MILSTVRLPKVFTSARDSPGDVASWLLSLLEQHQLTVTVDASPNAHVAVHCATADLAALVVALSAEELL